MQILIETAWRNGFDADGAHQLKNRLVDTRKWIGATDVVTALTYLGVRTEIIDFHRPTGQSPYKHPKLVEFVYNEFCKSGIRYPVYLQHSGHSRTIVGVEKCIDGAINLIVHDPARPVEWDTLGLGLGRRDLGDFGRQTLERVRLSMAELFKEQYQIFVVKPCVLAEEEREIGKIITSRRIPP